MEGYSASCKWVLYKFGRDSARFLAKLGFPLELCLKRSACQKASLDCSRTLPGNTCSTTSFLAVMLWEATTGGDIGECLKARATLKAWPAYFLTVDWDACLGRERSAVATIACDSIGDYQTWLVVDECSVSLHSLLEGKFPAKQELTQELERQGFSGDHCDLADLMVMANKPKFYWLLRHYLST